MTSYDGVAIEYDLIGNPTSYYNGSAYTFTWTGRQLTGAAKGSTNMSFTYNDEGIRTSKTVNNVTHTYYLNGNLIVAEQWGNKLIVYLYDSTGMPIGMMYRTTSYAVDQWDVFWFEKNLQGDIVAVYNSTGTKVASYNYIDAWGNHSVSYTNGGGSTGAQYNPFRYRGYYYDTDLGMYYLQSRYYDPNTCRFINADSVMANVGGNVLSNNLYAYCFNNPVNLTDSSGNWPQWITDAIGWIGDNIVTPVKDCIEEVEASKTSTDNPADVLSADFVANYKGRLVIRVPGDFGLSFGVILLGNGSMVDDNVLKHEYGHTVQLEKMGLWDYTTQVAAPSVTAWFLANQGKLPFDYHSSPWEHDANVYGGVDLSIAPYGKFSDPWTSRDGYFWDLIKLF